MSSCQLHNFFLLKKKNGKKSKCFHFLNLMLIGYQSFSLFFNGNDKVRSLKLVTIATKIIMVRGKRAKYSIESRFEWFYKLSLFCCAFFAVFFYYYFTCLLLLSLSLVYIYFFLFAVGAQRALVFRLVKTKNDKLHFIFYIHTVYIITTEHGIS